MFLLWPERLFPVSFKTDQRILGCRNQEKGVPIVVDQSIHRELVLKTAKRRAFRWEGTMNDRAIDKYLVGYCGLYCGGCDTLRIYRKGQEESRPPEWSELPERIRVNLPLKPKPIICEGCGSDTVFGGCALCPFRKCARKRAVTLCMACDRYPCFRHHLFGLLSKVFRIRKKLPHQMIMADNIERIRAVGIDTWLVEQDAKWRCPDCQEPYSWYLSTCQGCGRSPDELKGFIAPGK